MAEKETKHEHKHDKLEREYVIPLRKEWLKVPMYRRSRRAVDAIRKFLAKHMKVENRDVNKVKLDVYFNNEIWFRGRTNPPAKVKVKAIKENGIVRVEFAEVPEYVKFLKGKHEKVQKRLDSKAPKEQPKAEEKKEEKTEEEKKDEKEKEVSTAEANAKQLEIKAKEQKNVGKAQKTQRPVRMALQK
jgi:large subunit ribosomal protein L31e